MNKKFTKLIAAIALLVFMTPSLAGWGQTSLATWEFTSTNFPSNKTDFNATGGPCTGSTFYLNGSGSTWNATKGYAFTSVTDIVITLKLDRSVSAGDTVIFSAYTFYNKASNAPMKGFDLTVNENNSSYSTTGLNTTSWTLSNSSTLYFVKYTIQNNLSENNTIALKLTGTGSAGSGQGYMNDIAITHKSAGPTPLTAPTNFAATPGNEQAQFTWDAVTNASSYTISYTPANGTEQTETGITGTSRTITGLTNDVAYTCKIKAVGNGTTYSDSDYTSTITITPTGATFYNVTIASPMTGGAVTAEPTTATAGTTITLTAAPAAGYTFNNAVGNWSVTPVSTTINPVANTNTATFVMPEEDVNVVSANFTPIAVTLNAGNGTVNGSVTATWNVSMNGGNLPDAVAPCDTWSFEGWSTSVVGTETTTRPTTFVSTTYVPTGTTTLYAVYKKVDEVSFDNTQGGNFQIYAAVTVNGTTTKYYAKGSVSNSNITSTTTLSEATTYTFTQQTGGGYTIKNGNSYIGAGSSANLNTNETTWTATSNNDGTWQLVAGGNRALMFRTEDTNNNNYYYFKNFSTSASTIGTEYFYVYIGGGSTTYYCSTADCVEPLVAPTITLSSGTYTEVKTTTITYDNAEATIRYTIGTNPADPTSESTVYTLGTNIEINESCILKAKAFLGEQESPVATATYTINLPQVFATISAFKAAFSATSDEEVTITGPLTVVYQHGISTYVQDATGGLLIYDSDDEVSGTYTNGQTVSNIKGKYVKYSGLVEFVPTEDLPTPGTGTAVEPVDITSLTAANYATYESRLVRLTNAEFTANATLSTSNVSNVNMKDANNNVVVLRNGFKTLAGSIANEDVANVTGFATIYTNNSGTTYQLFPRDNNDVQYILETMEIDDEMTIDFAAIVKNNEIVEIADGGILSVSGTLTNNGDLWIADGGQLYTNNVVEATIEKTILAYDPDLTGQGVSNRWYFISYPLNCDYAGDPATSVTNMIASTAENYDLYKLVGNTWANYKQNADETNIDPGFTLYTGHGYLYANAYNVSLEFAGSVNYTDPDNPGISLENGYNLVGNPYAYNAYPSVSYYKMNNDGTAITADLCTDVVPPCTGIIVDNRDESIQEISFSKNQPQPDGGAFNGNLQMTVAQQATNRGNASTIDNAIVSFNEGSQLGKFYFGRQNANLYIPQGSEEYAIVSANGQGEMPVNFRANENGTYTLTVSPENVEMNYLHLIDNMTGADIDLLAAPSYTFNAKTTDYESRFRLVFASANQNEDGNDNFAFFSNGQLVINNNGQATLQVIDMQGRILSSETINGSVSTSLNAPVGVYVLRLVNGNDVKVQKMVVR